MGSSILTLGDYAVYRNKTAEILDYFVFYGPEIEKIVERFCAIIGKPALIPKYALGYLSSSMGYAEDKNAQQLIENFIDELKYHSIPCDLLHLSSGYTVDSVTEARNVFTWNRDRFPNPTQMFSNLKQAGIKTVVNVKPWLLKQHPGYPLVADNKGFVWNPEENIPSETRLWSAGAGF